MYENITYAELKTLPKEEKAAAWKELMSMYSTKKELAEKLGVSPNLVYNMISRYAKYEPDGTEKNEGRQAVEQIEKAGRRTKRKNRSRLTDNNAIVDISGAVQEINPPEGNESFSISIKKTISGEDAQFLFSGIGSTLLRDQKYIVEVRITER